jgi:hypothetical protein
VATICLQASLDDVVFCLSADLAIFVLIRQGVDPGLDPLFNHMNYVPTPCQAKKGRFTGGQMVTMVSKFGTLRGHCASLV